MTEPAASRNRSNGVAWTGVAMILSTPISSVVSFAIVSSIIGEERLEGENGQTTLGVLVLLLPAIVGLFLVAYGMLSKSPKLPRPGPTMAWVGALLTALSIGGIINSDPDVGANIGAGILIILGLPLLIAGVVIMLNSKTNKTGKDK